MTTRRFDALVDDAVQCGWERDEAIAILKDTMVGQYAMIGDGLDDLRDEFMRVTGLTYLIDRFGVVRVFIVAWAWVMTWIAIGVMTR